MCPPAYMVPKDPSLNRVKPILLVVMVCVCLYVCVCVCNRFCRMMQVLVYGLCRPLLK